MAVKLKDGDSIDSLPFINLIDVTLACEDAYSKLVEIVADVRDEDCVGNNLLQIWKLRFGHKAFVQTLSTLVKILKLNIGKYSEARFGQDFEA